MLIKVLENVSCYHMWRFETYELCLKSRNHALTEDQGGGVQTGEDVLFAIVGLKIEGVHGGRGPLYSIHKLPIISWKDIMTEFE